MHPALVAWNYGYKNRKTKTYKPEKPEPDTKYVGMTSMESCITKAPLTS